MSTVVVHRPRLQALLDRALSHRLTLVIADAGFGKTTLVTTWSAGINAVVHDVTPDDRELSRFSRNVVDALRLRVPDLPLELTGAVDSGGHTPGGAQARARPDAMAELLGSALQQRLFRDVALVLDNAHLLRDGPSLRFLAGVIRHAPPLLHVVLASRTEPPIPVERLRERGDLVEIHGADLDFAVDEVGELLADTLPDSPTDLARVVHDATAGWPSAVRMAIESLRRIEPRRRAEQLVDLTGGQGRLTELARSIYRAEPACSQQLLATVALFDEVTVELLEALGVPAREPVATMTRRGLFLEPGASGEGWYRLHNLAADVVAERSPITGRDAQRLRLAAADWFVANGMPHAALRAVAATDQHRGRAILLRHTGQQLLTQGYADDVAAAVEGLPAQHRDPQIERLAGEAYQLRGQWGKALACYARAEPEHGALDAGLGWRMGLIRYLRGELDAAIAIYERARIGDVPSADVALLLAWQASAHWKLGNSDTCGRLVAQALRVATEVDDARALAAVHTVLGMLAVSEGDRRANDAHYLKAVQYAEQAGDLLQLVRIRCNRGSHLAEEGDFHEALAELDISIRLADLSGFAAFGALALSNRGEANLGLGRLEEAQRDLDTAAKMFDELGSAMVSYPLAKLGTLHHLRGNVDAARTALEAALKTAEEAQDVQATVPALVGLAKLTMEEDSGRALELAKRAVAAGGGVDEVHALLTAGWAGLADGDGAAAQEYMRSASVVAVRRRDRCGAAEAQVLQAALLDDDKRAVTLAEQAARQCEGLGDVIGLARAALVRAERLEEAAAVPALACIRTRMRSIGCRLFDARAAELEARLNTGNGGAVRIETLGGFRVLRDGEVLASSAWKSAKARLALKILISRRGKAITREQLMDLLWPGEHPDAVANRLNVAVSTTRSMLDPDRRLGPDGFLCTEGDAVRLKTDHLRIDVDDFLADATEGFRLWRDHRHAEAVERFARAEAAYTGDFLEEDLYEDWAIPLREQASAVYREVTVKLSAHARTTGDLDAAIRYLLRILERDPYDEQSHLELVSVLVESGRHGDARRHYRTYCARMDELGVEAEPFRAA